MQKIRIVHYINQFFAQIGGEEMAHVKPEYREGPVGPGLALQAAFGEAVEVVRAPWSAVTLLQRKHGTGGGGDPGNDQGPEADLFIAGPAFNAGRYGVACGAIATAVKKEMGIPALTGMYEENPGADMFKAEVYIVATRNSAVGMRDAVKKMSSLALKLARNEKIGASVEDGYLPQGIRVNLFEKERGSKRAVDMLLKSWRTSPSPPNIPCRTLTGWIPSLRSRTSAKPRSPWSPQAASCPGQPGPHRKLQRHQVWPL